jgi:predicted ATPase
MLEELRIKNFKLLRDVEIRREGNLTVLIGPNASGKSTVIEVLDFLARSAEDGLEAALVAHGGMAAIRTVGVTSPIEIHTYWKFFTHGQPQKDDRRHWNLHWTLRIDASPNGRVRIVYESIKDGETELLTTSEDGVRTVIDESEANSEPSKIMNSRELGFLAFVDPKRYRGLSRLRNIVRMIRVIGVLSSAPSWARASLEKSSPRDALVISTQAFVGREGVGLATALYNLQTDHADAWANLHRALQAEFPWIKRIVFPPDPGGARISFALEDQRFPGRKIFASEMSDGIIVYLCLLSLILHPSQRAVLALDEPDAHLHPSAVRRLMAFAHEPSNRHLIIVTHSNSLLDELQDPAASIRIVTPSRSGAQIKKVDAAALKTWRAEYLPSDLRRTGLLDPTNSDYEAES